MIDNLRLVRVGSTRPPLIGYIIFNGGPCPTTPWKTNGGWASDRHAAQFQMSQANTRVPIRCVSGEYIVRYYSGENERHMVGHRDELEPLVYPGMLKVWIGKSKSSFTQLAKAIGHIPSGSGIQLEIEDKKTEFYGSEDQLNNLGRLLVHHGLGQHMEMPDGCN